MDETVDNRVARLEFRADAQDKEITSLKVAQETFGKSLEAIEKTLLQIKWLLYGAGAAVAANTLGISQAITKFIVH